MACEQPVEFDSGGLRLHGVLYAPAQGRGELCVICDPFAEEKKCAQRVLTEMARALAERGIAALRFDYRGTGDSEGSFVDFGPEEWLTDVLTACSFAREQLAAGGIGLLGLRVGATLAARAAESRLPDDTPAAWLVMWEPIINGKRYVAHNLQRSQIRAMLTEGGEFDAQRVAEEYQQEVVDFDGYRLSKRTQEQLGAIDMLAQPVAFEGPTLVLNIGPREQPGPLYVQLAQRYAQGRVLGVRQEPFWNKIGLVDPGPAVATTCRWLAEVRQTMGGDEQ